MFYRKSPFLHKILLTLVIGGLCSLSIAQSKTTPENNTRNTGNTRSTRSTRPTRKPDEVRKLILEAGRTNPDWWASTPLAYPDTLDIAGNKPARGWKPNVNLGAYIWDRVNKVPSNWRKGARLMHHVVDSRKRNPESQAKAMSQLAHIYFDLLLDYPRAAYWYERIAKTTKKQQVIDIVHLAECYWQMGSRSLAYKTLNKYGLDGRRPHSFAIQLLAQMGDHTRAIAMAKKLSKVNRRADEGMIAAARACRHIGKLEEAVQWYEKVLALQKGSRYLKLNRTRAEQSLKAVRILLKLDISNVADGIYTGSAIGYRGDVPVEVTIAAGKITALNVMDNKEDVIYNNFTLIPQRIIENGDLSAVDAVTGASITSDAILNAATIAIGNAPTKPENESE